MQVNAVLPMTHRNQQFPPTRKGRGPVAFSHPTVLMLPREGHWGHRKSSQRPPRAEGVGGLSAGHIPRPRGRREGDLLSELHLAQLGHPGRPLEQVTWAA